MEDYVFCKDIWGGVVEVSFVTTLTNDLPVTAVSCIAITVQEKNVILAKVPRGFDLPGGHLEPSETRLEALNRELKEEIGATVVGRPILLGYRLLRKIVHAPRVAKYPELSAIAIYISLVRINSDFRPQKESQGRALIALETVGDIHHHWSDQEKQIFDYAISKYPTFFKV